MSFQLPASCPIPNGRPSELFRGEKPEEEQKALREEMRQRLHPITCRICRQELAYFRDVGRFPLEEDEVQVAYREGRGYRSLLTVWWGRVSDHLSGELREMPAVSSYYRHMSFHLGVRTEREPLPPAVPTAPSLLARSGGFATVGGSAPPSRRVDGPAGDPSFPLIVPVPAPHDVEGSSAASAPPRVEPLQVQRSMARMTRTMAQLAHGATPAAPSGGYAVVPSRSAEGRKRRKGTDP